MNEQERKQVEMAYEDVLSWASEDQLQYFLDLMIEVDLQDYEQLPESKL